MTNGDKIREMNDWDLAVMFETVLSESSRMLCKKLEKNGIYVNLVETPMLSRLEHFKWLQQEAKE